MGNDRDAKARRREQRCVGWQIATGDSPAVNATRQNTASSKKSRGVSRARCCRKGCARRASCGMLRRQSNGGRDLSVRAWRAATASAKSCDVGGT